MAAGETRELRGPTRSRVLRRARRRLKRIDCYTVGASERESLEVGEPSRPQLQLGDAALRYAEEFRQLHRNPGGIDHCVERD